MTENYSDLSEDKTNVITIRCSPADIQRLDNEWKGTGKFFSRAHFVKTVINKQVGDVVFK